MLLDAIREHAETQSDFAGLLFRLQEFQRAFQEVDKFLSKARLDFVGVDHPLVLKCLNTMSISLAEQVRKLPKTAEYSAEMHQARLGMMRLAFFLELYGLAEDSRLNQVWPCILKMVSACYLEDEIASVYWVSSRVRPSAKNLSKCAILNNLAVTLHWDNRHRVAELLLFDAMKSFGAKLAEEGTHSNPDLASMVMNFSIAKLSQKQSKEDKDKCLEMFRRVRDCWKEHLGTCHPSYQKICDNIKCAFPNERSISSGSRRLSSFA
jgi:hypothetical protein